MGLTCKVFGHKWNGCKCGKCATTRDEQHDWDLCKGKCKRCGKTQEEQHEWNGCKCLRCGKTRDEQHDWDLCKGRCKRCGKTQAEQHEWDGCKCTRCGVEHEFQVAWERIPEKQKELAIKLAEFSPFGNGVTNIVSVNSLNIPTDQVALTYVAIHSKYKIEVAPLVIKRLTDKKLLEYLIEKFKDDDNAFAGKKIKESAKEQLLRL